MKIDYVQYSDSSSDMPVVSIIIVNWNGEQFLRDCFLSLKAQTFQSFEVIFVDNASADDSVPLAKRLASRTGLPISIIKLPTNTGFTGGNIEGLKHCSGRYIALLNNDTAANNRWLETLVRAMDSHPEVGICASKLIVAGTDIIDSAGDGIFSNLRPFKRGQGLKASTYETEEYVFGACAGAALYRKDMLDKIGFLDDDFFLIYEDADLNFRAQLSGWKCLFVPDAVVQHKVSAGLQKLGEIAVVYAVRNEKAVIIKNVPFFTILEHLPIYILEELVFSVVHHIRIGRFRSYIRGNYEFMKKLPNYLRKRRHLMRLRKVSTSYINSLLISIIPIYKNKIRTKFKFTS
jgi:GT2 family glycosyltransferase